MLPTTARDLQLNLDGSWGIGGKIHGGYLLSEIVRAALDRLPESHPHPLAVSAQFLSAPDAGPADLTVEVLRTGRSISSLRASAASSTTMRTGNSPVRVTVPCHSAVPATESTL